MSLYIIAALTSSDKLRACLCVLEVKRLLKLQNYWEPSPERAGFNICMIAVQSLHWPSYDTMGPLLQVLGSRSMARQQEQAM